MSAEGTWICTNPACGHVAMESQAMVTQGVCAACRSGGRGEHGLECIAQPVQAAAGGYTPGFEDVQEVWRRSRFSDTALAPVALTKFLHACDMANALQLGCGFDVVFHSTSRANLTVIRESGLVRPDGVFLGITHGKAWGPGIYASEDYSFTLPYGDLTLICLALPGMAQQFRGCGDEGGEDLTMTRAGQIQVYRTDCQVLPCAVVETPHDIDELRAVAAGCVELLNVYFPGVEAR